MPDLIGLDVETGKEVWRLPTPRTEISGLPHSLCRLNDEATDGLLGCYFHILRFNSAGQYEQCFRTLTMCRAMALTYEEEVPQLLYCIGHRAVFALDWTCANSVDAFSLSKDDRGPLALMQDVDDEVWGPVISGSRSLDNRFQCRLWEYFEEPELAI